MHSGPRRSASFRGLLSRTDYWGLAGFLLVGVENNGVIEDNVAKGHAVSGFYARTLENTVRDIQATENTTGFAFFKIDESAKVIGNRATENTDRGWGVTALDGTFSDNLSRNNAAQRFAIEAIVTTGVFTDNRSFDNAGEGYKVATDFGGAVSNNTGSGNAIHNTYP